MNCKFVQDTLFSTDNERVLDIVFVAAVAQQKNRKDNKFLCITLTTQQPISVKLHVIKGDPAIQVKMSDTFSLREVQYVDGLNPRKQTADFQIKIRDSIYILVSNSYDEKVKFIRLLYNLAEKYMPKHKPEFVNITLPVEHTPVNQTVEETEAVITEKMPISAKEEQDFVSLLDKVDLTVGQAKEFQRRLNERLSELDGANIQSIMGNEHAVFSLINLMDDALGQVNELEEQLNGLDNQLHFVRDTVELIEEKDTLCSVERRNTARLMTELEDFVNLIKSLERQNVQSLQSPRLSDLKNIEDCRAAVYAMDNFFKTKTSLSSMQAYQEKQLQLEEIRVHFIDILSCHLLKLFDNMSSMVEESPPDSHTFQIQTQRYRALQPFFELVHWLRSARPNKFQDVLNRYILRVKEMYSREYKRFFGVLTTEVRRLNERRETVDFTAEDQSYMKCLEVVMGNTRNIVDAESKFCTKFFKIDDQSPSKQQLGKVLEQIFEPFNDVMHFINVCAARNDLTIMQLFAELLKKWSTHHDQVSTSQPFNYQALVRLCVKQHVDRLIDSYASDIRNYRIQKRSKSGILPCIEQFKQLINSSEKIFVGCERRTELEKWYFTLFDAVRCCIDKSAENSSKPPASVVKFQNYHRLYLCLLELKVPVLDQYRDETKKTYKSEITSYVHEYMGKPLERIQVFFEQITRAIESGIKPEEIGYQQQFSRTELKKVIAAYPPKEVKKGLESLYRKIEKHLDDDSLLQVVWREMQDEFLKQLKYYQQQISTCYPNYRTNLEVSITDVLGFFSEIARQQANY